MIAPQHREAGRDAGVTNRPPASRAALWCAVILVVAVGLALSWRSIYVLDDTQLGWVYGGTRGSGIAVVDAGVHFRWPWQSVRRISRQIQWRDIGPTERPTQDGGSVTLTATAAWRVAPEGLSCRVQLPQDDDALAAQIVSVLSDGLNRQIAQQSLDRLQPVDNGRRGVPALLCLGDAVRAERGPWILERYGVELLDVSVTRLVIPEDVQIRLRQEATARRQAETDRILRAAATQVADIRSQAEKEAEQIKSDAQTEAASIRSQGRARAARFVAEARRPELESLLKAIESYHAARDKDATLVLEGGREFFRLLEGVSATGRAPAAQSRPAPQTASE